MDVLKFLHTKGADLFVLDSNGDNAVHWAARQGHDDVIEYLYQQGVSVNAPNMVGETPLHAAASRGHAKTAALLCSRSCDANQTNEKGETPLHIAVSEGHLETVRCLIAAGADPDFEDKHGCTALHIALRRHHSNVAIMLLQDGCNIDHADSSGEAPIHIAAKEGLLSIAQTLCAFGCKVDVPNKIGLYPLHLAAKNGHRELVRCLCLAGCNVEQKNKDGIAAEISALAQGHTVIGDLLNRLRNAHVREEYISQLIPSTRPVAKIKLKLFGHSGVGKSTFVDTLKCGYLSSWFRRSMTVGTASPKSSKFKKDITSKSSIELNSPGADEKPLSFETQYETYTQGVDVQQANISGIGDVSIWEFSGHEPYFMTYDNFIGNTNCLHLVLFRLTDPYEVQVRQVLFWIAFLLSRIVPQEPLGFCGKSGKPARIALVATHADAACCHRVTSTGEYVNNEAACVLRAANRWFGRCVELHESVFVLDGHVVGSSAIKALKCYVAHNKDKVTQGLPKSTGFLESTCYYLPQWRKTRACFPALPWQQFIAMIREEVNPLAGEEHMKELIQQLQIMGEVLYITCEDEDMVVIDPMWLCTTIVGHLLSHHNQERARVTGIYSADDIQLLFPEAEGPALLQILEAIQLCTECETDGEIEYEFPCFNLMETLDGLWTPSESSYGVYGGVRLHCRYKHILSSLFPRLQVHLRRSAKESADPDIDLYQWFRGSKFCSGVLEGLVTLDPSGEGFEVKVRGPAHMRAECFYFQEDLVGVIEQMLTDTCPGLVIERHVLSSTELHQHSPHPSSYSPLTTVTSLLQDGIYGTLDNPHIRDTKEAILDLVFLGAPEVLQEQSSGPPVVLVSDLHASQLSILSCQCLSSILDAPEPMGRDWCMLGVLLGMTDKLPKLDPGDNPAFSPTSCILGEWAKRPDSTIGLLLEKLQELERNDAIEQLVSTLPMFRIGPEVADRSDQDFSACDSCDVLSAVSNAVQ